MLWRSSSGHSRVPEGSSAPECRSRGSRSWSWALEPPRKDSLTSARELHGTSLSLAVNGVPTSFHPFALVSANCFETQRPPGCFFLGCCSALDVEPQQVVLG